MGKWIAECTVRVCNFSSLISERWFFYQTKHTYVRIFKYISCLPGHLDTKFFC